MHAQYTTLTVIAANIYIYPEPASVPSNLLVCQYYTVNGAAGNRP